MDYKGTKCVVIEPEGAPTSLENILLFRLPQVRFIARGIHHRLPSHVLLEDLIQAGTLGLIDAINKFNPSKHVKLEAYAKFRIRGAIIDSLREMDWGPRCLRGHGRNAEAARQALRVRFNREPNEEELSLEMHMSLEKFQRLECALHGLGLSTLDSESLDTQSRKIANINLQATPEMDPFSLCFQGEMRAHIEHARGGLDHNERLVLTLYYSKELTMKEIGRALGIGESRVSQIHSKAVFHLREQLGKTLHPHKQKVSETDDVHSDANTIRVERSD